MSRGTSMVVATVWCALLTGCDNGSSSTFAPDGNSATSAASAGSKDDPFEIVAGEDQYDPPPLYEAIEDNDLERLRDLIAAGEDVNQRDRLYGTPLIAALQEANDRIAAALIRAGAEQDGDSAFFLEARKLPSKTNDLAIRAVAEEFAENNGLDLREYPGSPALLIGVLPNPRGQLLVDQHQAALREQGWFLFRFAHEARRQQDVIGLLPTAEKYVVLAYLRTDGLELGIKTEQVINWLQRLEGEQPFVLTEAGLDYVGGKFLQPIVDPEQLAKRMHAFCPDIVDKGIGTVANLQRELAKPEPKLYLWWD